MIASRVNRLVFWSVVAAGLILVSGIFIWLGQQESLASIRSQPSAAGEGYVSELRIGLFETNSARLDGYEQLFMRLTEATGVVWRLVPIVSTSELIRRYAFGELDGVLLGGAAAYRSALLRDSHILVQEIQGGRTACQSTLIVAADSEISEIEELRGKRAAFLDPYSTTGYLIPQNELAAVGIDVEADLSLQYFAENQLAMAQDVVSGQADFGALGTVAWERLQEKQPELATGLRELGRYSRAPHKALVLQGGVATTIWETAKQHILAVGDSPGDAELLNEIGIDRFDPASIRDYESMGQFLLWTNDSVSSQ